jgi:hypothetical protein
MTAQLSPGRIESELITHEPEPASGKIMRRSLLVVLSIVLGVGVATCHVALTIAQRPLLDVIACGAMIFVVAHSFSRHSPERWGAFALALTVPALGLSLAFGLMGREVSRAPMWYFAPVIWLLVGGLAAILGRSMPTRPTTPRAA